MSASSFWAGLKKYQPDAEELVLNLYYFITKSPARRVDLFKNDQALGLNELVLQHCVESLAFPCAIFSTCHVYESYIGETVHVIAKEWQKHYPQYKYLIIRHALKSKEVGSSNGVFEKYQANLNMVSVEAAERSLDVGM